MSGAIKKANPSGKSVTERYGLKRAKSAAEMRKALNLKSAEAYKIHKLLAIPAGR